MKEVKTVINLVDQLSSVNFGIWHAAIASSSFLKELFEVKTILVVPKSDFSFDKNAFPSVKLVFLENLEAKNAQTFFAQYSPAETVVVSHGTWQFPTKWGFEAKKMGFHWVFTPHGMLEPWSMSQKKWKKWLYFKLKEKPMALKADAIRAVGEPEAENLRKDFSKVTWIPNGIYPSDISAHEKPEKPMGFLFLARLHHKKGVMPLLRAWKKSSLFLNNGFQLFIAGTPDGEEQKVSEWKRENPESNVEILGPTFGEEKKRILSISSFYVLPSLSEGFPTSVLEAMAAGLIPLISRGCNFPEVFSENLGLEIKQEETSLIETLNQIKSWPENKVSELAERNRRFVQKKFTWEIIARQQFELYQSIMN
jgi:glycosyltransferase involved in cell wall biosynthesis